MSVARLFTPRQSDTRRVRAHPRPWRRARRLVQAFTFLLFLYALVETSRSVVLPFANNLFFRLDPLAAVASMLAGRAWIAPVALSALTLALTLALGRFWCGWVCPLGTLLDWVPARNPRRSEADLHPAWRYVKHAVLFTILLAALFGSLTLMALDPITLLYRAVGGVLLPGVGIARQEFFAPNLVFAAMLAGVLALNAIRPRFWCRALCPLGALLGLASGVAWVRRRIDAGLCKSCWRCATGCPTGAIDADAGFRSDPVECIVCFECMETCHLGAVTFGEQAVQVWARDLETAPERDQALQSDRRGFLVALGCAGAGVALMRSIPALQVASPVLLRPPGAGEERLLSRCIRCGECASACPTGVVQLTHAGSGLAALWIPTLDMARGYCHHECNLCGHVCPTEAIPPLALEQKQRTIIGTARVDRERCLPWKGERPCWKCDHHCPVEGAVESLPHPDGALWEGHPLEVPQVREDICNGCGYCLHECPVEDGPALYVEPLQSARNRV